MQHQRELSENIRRSKGLEESKHRHPEPSKAGQSMAVMNGKSDLRLFEQTYDISIHVAQSNWNCLYCDC